MNSTVIHESERAGGMGGSARRRHVNLGMRWNNCQESPNGGKITILFFSGTRTPETLLSHRNYSQSKYISTNNLYFGGCDTSKIYFVKV